MNIPILSPIPLLKENTVSADTFSREKTKEACADFEALLLQQILETARKNPIEGGLFEESFATDIFKSMRNEEISKEIARNGGVGLGEALSRQLSGQLKSTGN